MKSPFPRIAFLILVVVGSGLVRAQVVVETGAFHRSDAVPARNTGVDLRALILLPQWQSLDLRYALRAMSQDSAYFLPARDATLHELRAAYAALILDGDVQLRLEPALLQLRAAGATVALPGGAASMRLALLRADALTLTADLAASHGLLDAGMPAIRAGILRNDLRAAMDARIARIADVSLHTTRSFLSDGNVLDAVYATVLRSFFHNPELTIGYAFQYANARRDLWHGTGADYDGTTGLYRYTFFYNPYYTPQQLRGHMAIVGLRVAAASWMSMALHATLPFASRNARSWFPLQGYEPLPTGAPYRLDEVGQLQSTVEGALQLELSDRSWLEVRAGHFKKPYYTSTEASVKFTKTM